MITSRQVSLLTMGDPQIGQIVEISRRWNVVELSVDTSQHLPVATHTNDGDPFATVDLCLPVDFGLGECGFKGYPFDVFEDHEGLQGGRVWITGKGMLERHFAGGVEWARHQKDTRLTASSVQSIEPEPETRTTHNA